MHCAGGGALVNRTDSHLLRALAPMVRPMLNLGQATASPEIQMA